MAEQVARDPDRATATVANGVVARTAGGHPGDGARGPFARRHAGGQAERRGRPLRERRADDPRPSNPSHNGRRRALWEYEPAHYHRAFRLTEDVAADKIGAELKNGVLTVRLPKAEAAKPRRIDVKGE